MKIIDNLLARIKEGVKEKGKKLIIPLTLTTLLTASAQEARAEEKSFLRKLLDRMSIEASYSYSKPDPLKDFYEEINAYYKSRYFWDQWGVPWREIKSPETLTTTGIGVNFKIYERHVSASDVVKDVVDKPEDIEKVLEGEKNRRLKIYLTAGYEKGKASASYNEVYRIPYPTWDPFSVRRNETYNLTKPKVGFKIEKGLSSKLSISGEANVDFYSVKGNADMTILIRGPPITDSTYIQWSNANYSGSSTGFSAGADLEYKLGKNVSVGVGGGWRNASVQTGGKEIVSSPQSIYTLTYPYSPNFNLSSAYLKGQIKLRF